MVSDTIAKIPDIQDPDIAAEIKQQLERICAHPLFSETTRLKRFLRHVVTETLEGRGDKIKGYTIGLAVFDRPESFDAQADTIVRVQAGQLRRRLDNYYRRSGQDDVVRIHIPRGRYIPVFERRLGGGIASADQDADIVSSKIEDHPDRFSRLIDRPQGPTVLIDNFQYLGPKDRSVEIAKGLRAEFLHALSRFHYIRVVSRTSGGIEDLEPKELSVLAKEYGAQYAIGGSIRKSEGVIRVTVNLVETITGKLLFCNNYDKSYTLENLLEIQEDIASKVACEIAAPYGVINRDIFYGLHKGVHLDAYEALLQYYSFTSNPNPNQAGLLTANLEKKTQEYPRYSSIWAALSLIYSFEASQTLKTKEIDEWLAKALKTAKRAAALDIQNSLAYHALFAAYFHMGDIEAYKEAAINALNLNPNDDNMLAFYAITLSMLGDYERACEISRRAQLANTRSPEWYNIPEMIRDFVQADYKSTLDMIRRTVTLRKSWGTIVELACYGYLGDQARASDCKLLMRALLSENPDLIFNIFKIWNMNSKLMDKMTHGWQLAGLESGFWQNSDS